MSETVDKVELCLVKGPEGTGVYLNDYRIAGPKPWGGGDVQRSWQVDRLQVMQAVGADTRTEAQIERERERNAALVDLARGAKHLLRGEKYYSEFRDDQIAMWLERYRALTEGGEG